MLQWQHDWEQGPRLFNLRILVCRPCLDVPQESGRTIVLPPDPIPVLNPRPENYVQADNPLSVLNYNTANNFLPGQATILDGNIGNMTLNAGVDAAFNGTTNKRAEMCAALSVSVSSFQNYVGKNWNAFPSGIALTLPASNTLTHILSSFALYAPNDMPFLNAGATGYSIDGSSNGTTWTSLASGTTAGTVGEILTGASTVTTAYPYHRAVIQGDGISRVAIAQFVINVSDQAPNDI